MTVSQYHKHRRIRPLWGPTKLSQTLNSGVFFLSPHGLEKIMFILPWSQVVTIQLSAQVSLPNAAPKALGMSAVWSAWEEWPLVNSVGRPYMHRSLGSGWLPGSLYTWATLPQPLTKLHLMLHPWLLYKRARHSHIKLCTAFASHNFK